MYTYILFYYYLNKLLNNQVVELHVTSGIISGKTPTEYLNKGRQAESSESN